MTDNPSHKFAEMRGRPPEDAKFFWNGGPVELAERTWFASMLSGVTAFDTDEGVVRAVELPVSDSPWLQPIYDEGEFIIRNVIRYYGGWFSGRPSELKPADRVTLASEMASLAGGTPALASRARELVGTNAQMA